MNLELYLNEQLEISLGEKLPWQYKRWADGCASSFIARESQILNSDRHLQRLNRGLNFLGIQPLAVSEWSQIIDEYICNREGSFRVNISVYFAGSQKNHIVISMEEICISSQAILLYPSAVDLDANWIDCDGAKPISYAGKQKVFRQLNLAQGEDFLWKREGKIIDASSSGILWVKDNELYCLSKPLVSSTTLDSLKEKLTIKETDLYENELEIIDEIILLNAVRGVIAVSKIGERKLTSWMSQKSFTKLVSETYEELWKKN